MSNTTIGSVTSRLRNTIKGVRQDSFLTDKYLYSLFRKYAAVIIRRADERGKILPFASIFETLDYVELEECDWVEAGCKGIKSYRTFRKTCTTIPAFTEGKYGPIVRSITSLDGSTSFQLTNLDQYMILSRLPNFVFNKTKYCWYLNDRLYFPNVDYPAVRIEGMFEEDIAPWKCNYDTKCQPRQQQSLNIPDAMIADIEKLCITEILGTYNIPSDKDHDAISITR